MKSARTVFVVFFFLWSVSFVLPPRLLAQESTDIVQVSVLPKDGFRFVLKRLGEKVLLTVYSLSPARKCQYYQKLLDYRLAELSSVAKDKDGSNIETTSSRYEATAGQLAEYAIAKKLDQCKQSAKELMDKHTPILERSQENFDYRTAEWRFLKNDINSLKIYSDKLK